MRAFAILGAVLVTITSASALFIKYHPFQEEKRIAVREEMSLRHIAERNNVPIDAMVPLLPPERTLVTVLAPRGIEVTATEEELEEIAEGAEEGVEGGEEAAAEAAEGEGEAEESSG